MEGVHRADSAPASKPWLHGRLLFGLTPHHVVAGVLAPAAWLTLTGCSSSGGDLISTVALPSQQSLEASEGDGMDVAADAGLAGKPSLTPAQRSYLDGLLAAGVQPANELRALSIGAYVCQARAAGQSDQAVWDAVAPMVRSDLADSKSATPAEIAPLDANTAIGHYVGIAQQKLC